MTDKLHCPFCGAELEKTFEYNGGTADYCCSNDECFGSGIECDGRLWKLAVDGKKAQDALNVARNLYQELALAYCEMVDDYRTTYGCIKTPEQETQEYMQEYDEKIISITKREK